MSKRRALKILYFLAGVAAMVLALDAPSWWQTAFWGFLALGSWQATSRST